MHCVLIRSEFPSAASLCRVNALRTQYLCQNTEHDLEISGGLFLFCTGGCMSWGMYEGL